MITGNQAEQTVREMLGPSRDGEKINWELVEFAQGWLIRPGSAFDPNLRGAAMRVIERDTGRIMRFPSSVPTDRIITEYSAVMDRGRVEGQVRSG